MATVWCQPCGIDGNQAPATVIVDGDPMCKPCAEYIQAQLEREGGARLPEAPIDRRPETPRATVLCPHGCGKPKHRGLCAAGRIGRKQPYKPGPRQAKAEIPRGVVATVCGVAESASEKTREALGELARSASAACNARKTPEEMNAERVAELLARAPLADLRAPRRRGLMDTLVAEVVRDEEVPRESSAVRKNFGRMGEIWIRLEELKPGQTLKIQNRDRNHLRMTVKNLREAATRHKRALHLRAVESFLYVRFLREGEPLHGAEGKGA